MESTKIYINDSIGDEIYKPAADDIHKLTAELLKSPASVGTIKELKNNIDSQLVYLKKWIIVIEATKDRRYSKENLRDLLAQAYLYIMRFRKLLLGQEIVYRIYLRRDYQNSPLDEAIVVDLTEEELMNYISRDRATLRLSDKLEKAFDELQENHLDSSRNDIFQKHFNNIETGLQKVEASGQVRWKARSSVIDDYFHGDKRAAKNLIWQDDPGKRGKSYANYKLFNRGWIYQAFDQTIEDIQGKEPDSSKTNNLTKYWNSKDTKDKFRKQYFTRNLDYDNIKGFKGGDVGLAQIKANMASLMSRTTLLYYFKIIYNILSQIKAGESENLTKYIEQEFADLNNPTYDRNTRKILEKNVNMLLKGMTNK